MAAAEELLRFRLPEPWNYGVTRDGRVFFINDEAHSTTWLHPLRNHPVQSGHQYAEDLPCGWERSVTPEGLPYFIDHFNLRTTFEHPVTRQAAAVARGNESNGIAEDSNNPMFSRRSSKRKSKKDKKVVDRAPSARRADDSPIAIQGWLYRQEGSTLKAWKKRWGVLTDFCLYLYKASGDSQPVGSVLLPSYKITHCTREDGISRKFAFKAEHQNMKTMYFAGETASDTAAWIDSLSQATQLQRSPRKDLSHGYDRYPTSKSPNQTREEPSRQPVPQRVGDDDDDDDAGFTPRHVSPQTSPRTREVSPGYGNRDSEEYNHYNVRQREEWQEREERAMEDELRRGEQPNRGREDWQQREEPSRGRDDEWQQREQPNRPMDDWQQREQPNRRREDEWQREEPNRGREDWPQREEPNRGRDDLPQREQQNRGREEDWAQREQPNRPRDDWQPREQPRIDDRSNTRPSNQPYNLDSEQQRYNPRLSQTSPSYDQNRPGSYADNTSQGQYRVRDSYSGHSGKGEDQRRDQNFNIPTARVSPQAQQKPQRVDEGFGRDLRQHDGYGRSPERSDGGFSRNLHSDDNRYSRSAERDDGFSRRPDDRYSRSPERDDGFSRSRDDRYSRSPERDDGRFSRNPELDDGGFSRSPRQDDIRFSRNPQPDDTRFSQIQQPDENGFAADPKSQQPDDWSQVPEQPLNYNDRLQSNEAPMRPSYPPQIDDRLTQPLQVDVSHTYENNFQYQPDAQNNAPLLTSSSDHLSPGRPPLPVEYRDQYINDLAAEKTPVTRHDMLSAAEISRHRHNQSPYFKFPESPPTRPEPPTQTDRSFTSRSSDIRESHHPGNQQPEPQHHQISNRDQLSDLQPQPQEVSPLYSSLIHDTQYEKPKYQEIKKKPQSKSLKKEDLEISDRWSSQRGYSRSAEALLEADWEAGSLGRNPAHCANNTIHLHAGSIELDDDGYRKYNLQLDQQRKVKEETKAVYLNSLGGVTSPPVLTTTHVHKMHRLQDESRITRSMGDLNDIVADDRQREIGRDGGMQKAPVKPPRIHERGLSPDTGYGSSVQPYNNQPAHSPQPRLANHGSTHRPIEPIKEDPNMPDSELLQTSKTLADLKRHLSGHTRLRLSISADDLSGKSQEELTLLLIALRRSQTGLEEALTFFRQKLDQIKPQEKEYKLQRKTSVGGLSDVMEHHHDEYQEVRKQYEELEKQIEVTKPLVHLLHNMVNLGSLYGGDNLMLASQYKPHKLSPDMRTPPKRMIEFSRQHQEDTLTRGQEAGLSQLLSDEVDLEQRLQQLFQLDRQLQDTSLTVTGLQQDKSELEEHLSALRSEIQEARYEGRELTGLKREEGRVEEELSELRHQLTDASTRLESISAENAKVENEVILLRKKIYGLRPSDSTTGLSTDASRHRDRLEDEVTRIQSVMDNLSKQGDHINKVMESLRNNQDPSTTDQSSNQGSYLETDLNTYDTKNLAPKSTYTPLTGPDKSSASQPRPITRDVPYDGEKPSKSEKIAPEKIPRHSAGSLKRAQQSGEGDVGDEGAVRYSRGGVQMRDKYRSDTIDSRQSGPYDEPWDSKYQALKGAFLQGPVEPRYEPSDRSPLSSENSQSTRSSGNRGSNGEQRHSLNLSEQRSEFYQKQPEKHQSQPDTYQKQPERYESQPDTYQKQPERYQSQPERYQSQPERYQSQPERYQSQPDTYQKQPEKYQKQPERYQSQPDKYQKQPEKYQSQPERYQSQPEKYQRQPESSQRSPESPQNYQSKFQRQLERHQNPPETYVKQPERYQNQPDTYVKQPERYQSQPDTYVKQPERHQNQPQRHQNQPETYVKQPERHQNQPDTYVKQPERYQRQPEKYQGQPEYSQRSPEFEKQQARTYRIPAEKPHMQPEWSPSSDVPVVQKGAFFPRDGYTQRTNQQLHAKPLKNQTEPGKNESQPQRIQRPSDIEYKGFLPQTEYKQRTNQQLHAKPLKNQTEPGKYESQQPRSQKLPEIEHELPYRAEQGFLQEPEFKQRTNQQLQSKPTHEAAKNQGQLSSTSLNKQNLPEKLQSVYNQQSVPSGIYGDSRQTHRPVDEATGPQRRDIGGPNEDHGLTRWKSIGAQPTSENLNTKMNGDRRSDRTADDAAKRYYGIAPDARSPRDVRKRHEDKGLDPAISPSQGSLHRSKSLPYRISTGSEAKRDPQDDTSSASQRLFPSGKQPNSPLNLNSQDSVRRMSDLFTPRPFGAKHSSQSSQSSTSTVALADKKFSQDIQPTRATSVATVKPSPHITQPDRGVNDAPWKSTQHSNRSQTNLQTSLNSESQGFPKREELGRNLTSHSTAGDLISTSDIPDYVKSPSEKKLQYNPDTIEKEVLFLPDKVEIPERYVPESDDEYVTEEERVARLEKRKRIQRMLAAQSLQDWTEEEIAGRRHHGNTPATLHYEIQAEKQRREHILDLKHELARQVTHRSKEVAEKFYEEKAAWRLSTHSGATSPSEYNPASASVARQPITLR